MEHSIVSRSPSGQWYPQQQQQQQQIILPQGYNANNMPPPPQPPQHYQQQWSPVSGAATPMMSPGGPAAGGGAAGLGNSGTLGSSTANLWNPGAAGGMGGGDGAGMPRASFNGPGGAMTPQQMMMQPGMYAPQDQCCASCCGPQSGGCCGGPQQSCCGDPQQPCCGGSQQPCCGGPQGGCCPMPGEPVDPFCCTPPVPGQEPPCYVSIYNCFDWTFLLACLLFVLCVIGFAVVMATKSTDDLFSHFKVHTTAELDAAMQPYIAWMNVNTTDSSGSSSSVTSSSSSSSGSVSSGSLLTSVSGSTVAASVAELAVRQMQMLMERAADAFADAQEAAVTTAAAAATTTTTAAPSASGSGVCRYSMTHKCTRRKLLGSFGALCMEDNMYANTFAVQLSSWTNGRDTLWFLAMLYSAFTLLYAILIHTQRHPSAGGLAGAGANSLPTITPQEQEEFMKMTPQQQQAFMQEYQQRVAVMQQQNPNAGLPTAQQPGAGCCGSDSGIEFYDTPYYEFVRTAWFVSGITAFVWACNLFLSFWAFSGFYLANTTGPLKAFWKSYTAKMNGSLIVVTIFLAWPLVNIFFELAVWIIGFLPWMVIRSTCKQGIAQHRPSLPQSQLPMYIRADMFFMDFNDVKRLGFSRQAWVLLTGSDKPYFECCEDPTVDRDPAMSQLMQQRLQWQQVMMTMMPPWMQQQPGGMMMGPNGQMMMLGPNGQMISHPGMAGSQQQQMLMMMQNSNGATGPNTPSPLPGTPATVATNGALLPTNSPANTTPAEYPVEEEGKTHRRRRRSTHDRHRHADPSGGGAAGASPMESTSLGLAATTGGAAGGNSTRHRHRRRSRSRSQSKGAFEGGSPGGDGAAVPEAGGQGNTPGHHHRRRHSRSRSMEAAGGNGGASPTPGAPAVINVPVPPAAGEEGGGGHRRRRSHSRSRSQSKAAGSGGAAAAEAAGQATPGGGGADGHHRHRRRSHSRSREKPAGGGGKAAATDLDALMQL